MLKVLNEFIDIGRNTLDRTLCSLECGAVVTEVPSPPAGRVPAVG